jgi:glycosyltransferase involved in cell wall biosynthesis
MAGMDAQDSDTIVGCTDGYRLGYVEGWAWRPNRPHDTVVVQLLADGALVAEATACLPRPDLSTAGIGHGQHAFAIPFTIEPDAPAVLHLTVRAKDGPVLPDGEFDIETSAETRADLAQRRSIAHLEQVFGPFTAANPPSPGAPPPPQVPRLNFVLYAARANTGLAGTLGMPEYSYVFVMRGFREVLRRLGTVHQVRDPADVDAIHDACLARGESCLLLSFAPPQSTPLGLRCPTIPVIAWEFGTIPTGGWLGDAREDWRLVLRQTGRAITISDFAARAVRATMGAAFPVIFIPTPVWDRLAGLRARLAGGPAAGRPASVRLDGYVWDSRVTTLSVTMRTPPLPPGRERAEAPLLPMRGAQLALARASAAAQASAREEAADVAEAAEAAARQTAAGAQEAAAREAEARAAVPVEKNFRARLRFTAFLARQWYREVVRDVLPRPVIGLISTAGRMVIAARARPVIAAVPPPEPVALPPADPGVQQAPQAPQAARIEAPPAPEPPVTARYLPVGDGVRPAGTNRIKYCPAPEFDPLPEPDLALFVPDPYPDARAPAPGTDVDIGGIVFTAVLSPKDGRKNWQDILTAFVAAFTDQPDATLVLKMIGSDPTYWYWEFCNIVKALPAFRCRVLVLSGYLADPDYQALIAATHFVVNASLAEGQCLPLVEFMSGHRPAIAPLHTAMLDYIGPDNAVIVASEIEFCSWPHDPRNYLLTTRHRIEWPSLREAFSAAWRIAREEPTRYAAMAEAAAASVRDYCSDATVAPVLAGFLGLGDEVLERAGWVPLQRAAAEPLLEPFAAAAAGQPA